MAGNSFQSSYCRGDGLNSMRRFLGGLSLLTAIRDVYKRQEETVSKLRKEYAGIHIIGYRDGYIKANEERERLIKDIKMCIRDSIICGFLKKGKNKI